MEHDSTLLYVGLDVHSRSQAAHCAASDTGQLTVID